MGKVRLDRLLAERGLAPSREKAEALILAGQVLVNDRRGDKPGARVPEDVHLALKGTLPYVSRGGLKLEHALRALGLPVQGWVCLDVGASTGGFTDLLLSRGARRVIALDVGKAQLAWKLRTDPRVIVLEGVNARHLGPEDLPFPVQLAVVDVAFISLRLVVPPLLPHLEPGAHLVCLVKPQFEAGRHQVGKGGIVREEAVRRLVIDNTVAALQAFGLELLGIVPSPIHGQKGNLEELAAFRWGGE